MKIFYQLIFYVVISFNLNSQNLNYSQFYSSPLNLNPAMTGIGEFGRVGVNYRNQWPSYVGPAPRINKVVQFIRIKDRNWVSMQYGNIFDAASKSYQSARKTFFGKFFLPFFLDIMLLDLVSHEIVNMFFTLKCTAKYNTGDFLWERNKNHSPDSHQKIWNPSFLR